ncbi:hypothetical protein HHI36_008750 [Cryptolaemus montrouzieri]|uniref:THAP-type domain-containing protein n=1 Tax=Cryptolaemus montrouzieri TaxID=559131 RepID=A0ABD2MU64_9CUCU
MNANSGGTPGSPRRPTELILTQLSPASQALFENLMTQAEYVPTFSQSDILMLTNEVDNIKNQYSDDRELQEEADRLSQSIAFKYNNKDSNMVMCFAPDCKHYSERDRCRFFVFPSDEVERKRWIALLRREDKQPSRYSLVCSCHFIDKDRNNGPTLFEHNKTKRLSDLSSASEPKAKKSK